jgi:hypothetical protein
MLKKKTFPKLSKIWVWDPGSEIRKKPIPDPGVKTAPDPGSGSATLRSGKNYIFVNFFAVFGSPSPIQIRKRNTEKVRLNVLRYGIRIHYGHSCWHNQKTHNVTFSSWAVWQIKMKVDPVGKVHLSKEGNLFRLNCLLGVHRRINMHTCW